VLRSASSARGNLFAAARLMRFVLRSIRPPRSQPRLGAPELRTADTPPEWENGAPRSDRCPLSQAISESFSLGDAFQGRGGVKVLVLVKLSLQGLALSRRCGPRENARSRRTSEAVRWKYH